MMSPQEVQELINELIAEGDHDFSQWYDLATDLEVREYAEIGWLITRYAENDKP